MNVFLIHSLMVISNYMLYLSSIYELPTYTPSQFCSYALAFYGHIDGHGKGRHTSMRTENCVAQPVVLHVAVTMAAFDSIASDMFGLMGRLISFQKPPWSRHCIALQRSYNIC